MEVVIIMTVGTLSSSTHLVFCLDFTWKCVRVHKFLPHCIYVRLEGGYLMSQMQRGLPDL